MNRTLAGACVCAGLLLCIFGPAPAQEEVGQMADPGITIRWWGQACFCITGPGDVSVLNDPFPEGMGYDPPTCTATVCTVSHEHRDHNAVERLPQKTQIIRGVAGEHEAAGITFTGVGVFHDDEQGARRGPNVIYIWSMADMRIAHFGDIGHLPTPEQLGQIGMVDVAMIPVGGFYTIDGAQAVELARQVSAKAIIPMHYKTAATEKLPISGLEPFLGAVPDTWQVERAGGVSVKLAAADLPEQGARVIVLDYK